LEFIIVQQRGGRQNKTLIYNTLLEQYLQDTIEDAKLRAEYRQKALDLLQDRSASYSPEQALVLCELHRFTEGILYLYEDKMKLYNEILQFYMNKFDYHSVIVTCRRHGSADPNLWVRSLFYFVVMDEPCEEELREVLQHIDRDNLLPPVQSIQILSQKKAVAIGLVREYIISRLEQLDKVTVENKKQVAMFTDDTDKMRAEIEEFRTSMKTIQAAKCSICSGGLDLPAVHFLCSHSFHQHCLPESADECIVCASSVKQLLETRRSLEQSADQHDRFSKQLEGSPDGFVTCAEYFGRHVFAMAEPLALPSDKVTTEQVHEEQLIYERRNPKKRPDFVKVVAGPGAPNLRAGAARTGLVPPNRANTQLPDRPSQPPVPTNKDPSV